MAVSGEQYFARSEKVSLREILDGREERMHTQKRLLERYSMPLISFTLNIPGEYKCYPLVKRAFQAGMGQIEEVLKQESVPIHHHSFQILKTGCEAFYCVAFPAPTIKAHMLKIEESHPLGRLLDIDVLDGQGNILHGESYGRSQRKCFLCGNPVWECARSRAHSHQQLSYHTAQWLDDYFQGNLCEAMG